MDVLEISNLIEIVETWATAQQGENPNDGISHHTLEILGPLKNAVEGDQDAIAFIRENFDLGLMAAKAMETDEYEEITPHIYKIDSYVRERKWI